MGKNAPNTTENEGKNLPIINENIEVDEREEESVNQFGKWTLRVPVYRLRFREVNFFQFMKDLVALQNIVRTSVSRYGFDYARRIYVNGDDDGDVLIGYAYCGQLILRDPTEDKPSYVVFSTQHRFPKLRDAKQFVESMTSGQKGLDRRRKEAKQLMA